MDLRDLKSECLQDCTPFEALGKNPRPCLFQSWEASGLPWLVATSSIFKVNNHITLPCFYRHIFSCLPLLRSLLLYWARPDIQDVVPILRSGD